MRSSERELFVKYQYPIVSALQWSLLTQFQSRVAVLNVKISGSSAKIVFIVLSIIICACWLSWHRLTRSEYSDVTAIRFYETLAQQGSSIDLSVINTVEWDALTFLSPYSDVCQYGINGYEPGGSNCFESHDDNESWLLFLKDNKLVAKVPIDRRKIDLTTAQFPLRLLRENAKFEMESKNGFTQVKLR